MTLLSSLRARVLWSVALLALLATGLLLVTAREIQRLAEDEASGFAREAEALVLRSLADAEREARTLTQLAAQDPAVVAGEEACEAALARVRPEGARVENLLRFDGVGRILCSARPFPEPRIRDGPRTREALRRVREGEEAFFLTGAFVDGDARSMLVYTRGLEGDAGGLMLGILLDGEEAPLFPGWPSALGLILLDAEGRLGLRLPHDLPGPEGDALPPREASPAEVAAAWGIADLETAAWLAPGAAATGGADPSTWLLLVGVREGQRLIPAAGVAVRNTAIGGGLLLVGFVLILLWLRAAVLPPMAALARASGILAAGDLSVRIDATSLPAELLPVSRAFNRLAEGLESSHEASAASRKALLESEARYRDLFEKSPHAMWIHDPETLQILDVNGAMESLYGFDRDALVQMTCLDLGAGEETHRLRSCLAQVKEGEQASEPRRWTHRHREGHPIHVELRARSIRLDGFQVCLVLALDVTARVEAEKGRIEAETRLREILANSRDCVWMQDAATLELLFVSPAYALIWGRDPAELMARRHTFLDTVHPEDRERTREARRLAPVGGFEEVYRITRPDGEVRWVLDRSFSIRNDEGEIYRIGGIASDISERMRLEEQLVVSQRLEAVGQLAGGLAHDFNNLLTVIRGHLELARLGPPLPEETDQELDDAGAACRKAAELVEQLLAFSRRQILLPEVVELGEVVRESRRLLRRALPDTVELAMEGLDARAPVRVDTGKVEQALLNLAINARDAMPTGGTLRLALDRREVRAAQAIDGPVAPGAYGVLSISDSGTGMDALTAQRAFDPFYTTKEPGKGSGLGLSMVHGIVDQSGGFVQLETALGQGTTFRLLFPLVEEGEGSPDERDSAQGTPDQGGPAEDDPDARVPVQVGAKAGLERE